MARATKNNATSVKKTTAKKPAAQSTIVKRTTATSAKKTTAKKPSAQSTIVKKTTARKPSAQSTIVKKTAVRKTNAKTSTTVEDVELVSSIKETTSGAEHLELRFSAERKKRQRTDGPPTDIPAISLAAMFSGDAAAKAAVAKQWDRACREVGFVKIKDHGVPKDVIDDCWKASEVFFDQPMEEKLSVPGSEDYPYGYTAVAGETLIGSLDKKAATATAGDLKEMFSICLGSATPAADMPAPRWPALSDAAVKAEMQRAYTAYNEHLASLTETLYRLCAHALDLDEHWFVAKNCNHRNVIRAIHYPAQKAPLVPQPGQVRASMHTDYGSLTILRLGGSHPRGLQVMDASGAWIDVTATPDEDCFVINLGDLMARWTNDRWLSTPHQVVNPSDEEGARARRNSIAYFCNINMDARVECIPTCAGDAGPKYEPIAAGEWLMKKHMQTVAGKLCYEKGKQ